MLTETDYDKLLHLMEENPENKALLQRLLDSQAETLRIISHEIRNPLTLVYSTIQLIEHQHPEVTGYRHWDSLKKDTEYMQQLLDELSSFNNGSKLTVSSFSLSALLKQIAVSYAASLADTDIEFTSYIAPDLPSIEGDSVKLKEVILNLLRNAADAVDNRSTDKRVHLFAACDISSGQIFLKIQDSGCGIPKEHLSDIFTPFVTYKQGGTGLGLAITDRIVTAHHGKISVESMPDAGTTFTIILPQHQVRKTPPLKNIDEL